MADLDQTLTFIPTDPSQLSEILGEHALPLQELEAAYARARGYLLDRANQLKTKYGWRDWDFLPEEMLFNIAPPSEGFLFCLPSNFSAFFEDSLSPQWSSIFDGCDKLVENVTVIDEKAISLESKLPPPLMDIVFLLQCLAPGMLIITTEQSLPGSPVKGLPSAEWIEKNSISLQNILSGPEMLDALKNIMETFDFEAYVANFVTHHTIEEEPFDDYADRSDYDADIFDRSDGVASLDNEYRDCDLGCGYCGRCADKYNYRFDL